MSETRAERLEEFERWAEKVRPEDLREADTEIVEGILAAIEDRPRAADQTTVQSKSA